jgi:hypothetical protein
VTEPGTKDHIVFSRDLPTGSPARHLLPASRSLYKDPAVIQDPIYRQVQATLLSKNLLPYLNNFTPALQYLSADRSVRLTDRS